MYICMRRQLEVKQPQCTILRLALLCVTVMVCGIGFLRCEDPHVEVKYALEVTLTIV